MGGHHTLFQDSNAPSFRVEKTLPVLCIAQHPTRKRDFSSEARIFSNPAHGRSLQNQQGRAERDVGAETEWRELWEETGRSDEVVREQTDRSWGS